MRPDSTRFFNVISKELAVYAPLSQPTVDNLIDIIPLNSASRILDIGCGEGEILLRFVNRFSLHATGVDLNPDSLAQAKAKAKQRGLNSSVKLIENNAMDMELDGSFDLIINIGASHACGNFIGLLKTAQKKLKPGGFLLFGERYWKNEPTEEYLGLSETKKSDFSIFNDYMETGADFGFNPAWTGRSSEYEWDDYEGKIRLAIVKYLKDRPMDPDAAAFAKRSRDWYKTYLQFGRDCLGFGLFLFQLSESPKN